MAFQIFELNLLLGKVSMALQGLGVLFGIARWPKNSSSQHSITLFLLVILTIQVVAYYYGKAMGNNYPFYFAYILIEGVWVISIYLFRSPRILPRQFLIALAIGYSLFWCIDIAWLESGWEYPAIIRPLESLMVIGLSIRYYRSLLNLLDIPKPGKTFLFWLSTGWMIYFTSTLLIELIGSLLVDASPEIWGLIFTIRNGLNVLLYLTFAVSLWLPDTESDE